MIPSIVAQVSTVPVNFPAILPYFAPIVVEFGSAGAVVQVAEVLSAVSMQLSEVTPNLSSIMANLAAPEICRSWRRYSEQTTKNQSP
jgi:uncharacterized membrane protein YoaK (UPF0700 family)